ncbi:hypothetical protein PMAN_a0974 [Pseudoalteromonas marina]|nr:hypothetical protein PMAN_a0974 [Pseudoalteromonas marina]
MLTAAQRIKEISVSFLVKKVLFIYSENGPLNRINCLLISYKMPQ